MECVTEYKKSKEKIELYNLYNSKLESFEYIFENYLVNKVFTDLIPFNKGEDLYIGINYLINIYKVIKAYVIGIAVGNEEKITDCGILRVIQAFSKDIEHNKVFEEILLS